MCRSTEEMIHHIKQFNARTDMKELVVFSTDLTAMFPELTLYVAMVKDRQTMLVVKSIS